MALWPGKPGINKPPSNSHSFLQQDSRSPRHPLLVAAFRVCHPSHHDFTFPVLSVLLSTITTILLATIARCRVNKRRSLVKAPDRPQHLPQNHDRVGKIIPRFSFFTLGLGTRRLNGPSVALASALSAFSLSLLFFSLLPPLLQSLTSFAS